jgi:branched-chain amino acid transport system substrate-binding protein
VAAFRKLVDEEKVDAIIGPSGSPNAMAIIPFAAETGTPVLTLVGGAAVVLPMTEQKKWMFKPSQNDDIIAQALIEEMVRRNVKTLGLILTADAFGESWNEVMHGLAKDNGIEIVVTERFQRQDTSVTGQSLRVKMAAPDAVLVAAPGGAAVLPQATLFDQGFKGQIYQTHGAAMDGFLKLGGAKVEDTILAASLMLVVDDVSDEHPSKEIAKSYINEYRKLYGQTPATFGAAVYDSGLLLEKAIPVAIKAARPGTAEFRSALRDALEQITELPGAQGVYNITPADHSGFDERGRVLITVDDGGWKLLRE